MADDKLKLRAQKLARELHAYLNSEGCGFFDDGNGPGKKCLDCEAVALPIAAFAAELVAEARVALEGVPDPEQEGFCESCGTRLELVKVGDAYKWQHLPNCWYFKVQATLASLCTPQTEGGR